MDIFNDLVLPDDTMDDWLRRRERMKARLMSYFGEPPLEAPPLEAEIGPAESFDGYSRRHVSYQVEPGARATAWLFVPDGLEGPGPVVMCYHGTNPMGKEAVCGAKENMNYAVELAQRGYVTLAPDQWAAGERAGVDDEANKVDKLYELHPEWSREGKTAWDHMRAVDFLETLDEANTAKLGGMGLSRGGRATVYHMMMDDRVKAGVPACGTPPYRGNPALSVMARQDTTVPRAIDEIRQGRTPGYDIHEVMGLIAPRALLLVSPFIDQWALHGRIYPEVVERVAQLYRFLGAGNNFARFAHGEGHNTGPILRAAIYAWLDYHLKGQVPGLPGRNWGIEAPGIDGVDSPWWTGISPK